MSAVAEWIRPWFPAGLVGHIYRDCPALLKWTSDPVEGSGWLHPRADGALGSRYVSSTCSACLHLYDPKLAAELGATNE